jgi:hypothetical protein
LEKYSFIIAREILNDYIDINIHGHYDDETLELYALVRIDEDRLPGLEEHLLTCEDCRTVIAEADIWRQAFSAASLKLAAEEKQATRGHSARLRWLLSIPKPVWAGAAAILLAILLIPNPRRVGPVITEVRLSTSRGQAGPVIAGSRGGNFTLLIDTTELPELKTYKIQVVDSGGSMVWVGITTATNHQIKTTLPFEFSSGVYWVRLYNARNGTALREFGFSVK